MLGGGVLFRSRLTHAIDSSIIAERIAVNHFKLSGKSLSMIRAAVFGHDLGQSPLGHGGDEALKLKLAQHDIDFDDAEGAIKVLTNWSNYGISYKGLNPALGTIRQIALGNHIFAEGDTPNHKSPKKIPKTIKKIDKEFDLELGNWADVEGIIAANADGLSWISEDILTGLVEGIFTLKELTSASPLAARLCQQIIDDMKKHGCEKQAKAIEERFDSLLHVTELDFIKLLTHALQQEMILDLVWETEYRMKEYKKKIKYADDVRKLPEPLVAFSPAMYEQWHYLFKFFGKYLYPRLLQASRSFEAVVSSIFDHLIENPKYMSENYKKRAKGKKSKALAGLVVEYMMREMTDKDIIEEIERIDPGLFEILLNNEHAKDISALV